MGAVLVRRCSSAEEGWLKLSNQRCSIISRVDLFGLPFDLLCPMVAGGVVAVTFRQTIAATPVVVCGEKTRKALIFFSLLFINTKGFFFEFPIRTTPRTYSAGDDRLEESVHKVP